MDADIKYMWMYLSIQSLSPRVTNQICWAHLFCLFQQRLLKQLPGDVLNDAIGLLKTLTDSTTVSATETTAAGALT